MADKNKRYHEFRREEFDRLRSGMVASIDEMNLRLKTMQENAKENNKKIEYRMKYLYVRSGHAKNEMLGFMTVFNAGRAKNINIKRLVRYDEDNRSLYLDIYQRKDRNMQKKAPVFVYIHGGGWIGGLPETREGFNTRIAEAGYFVVSLYYGHSPTYPHPEPIKNIYKAFAWLKENAEEYNIDTDEIFVGGESAGGHLSSMAGAISTNPEYNALFDLDERSRHQKIKALVLNCGVFDLEEAVKIPFKNIVLYVQSYCGGTPMDELSEEMKKEISPIRWINKDFPPTFCISGDNDKLAVLTFDLVAKLDDLGVEVAHYHGRGRWAVHAFAVIQFLKISKEAMFGVRTFMREHTQQEVDLPKARRESIDSAKTAKK